MNTKLLKLFFLISSLSSCLLFSQKIEIEGVLIDEVYNIPVEFATIRIQDATNQRLLGFALSNEKGAFSIEVPTPSEDMLISVTHLAYIEHKQHMLLGKNSHQLGIIKMNENTESLEAVIIKTQVSPMKVSRDTIQYKASAYKTKDEAVAEDLIKKLPGISLDPDTGQIQINGLDVNKILVNGEPYFQGNLKAALKTLPKELIDKIEVTNSMTDQEKFTGIKEDTQENKTINIVLRKDIKGFGNILGGVGTSDTYEGSGSYNLIKDKTNFNLLGVTNNINKDKLSYVEDGEDEINNLNNLKTTHNIGFNFSSKFDKDTKLNADYIYGNFLTRTFYTNQSSILLPTRTNISDEKANTSRNYKEHRLNLKFNSNLFKNSKITFTNNVVYKDVSQNSNSDSETSRGDTGAFLNSRESDNLNAHTTLNANSNLNFTQKLPKLSSFFGIRLNGTYRENDNNRLNNSTIVRSDAIILRNQKAGGNFRVNILGGAVIYNQKLAKFHNVSYEYRINNREDNDFKNTLDFDNSTQEFDIINDGLTYDQSVNTNIRQHKLSYIFNNKNFKIDTRVFHLTTKLDNSIQNLTQNKSLNKTFRDYLFSFRLQKYFSKTSNINLHFRNKSTVPKPLELLNIVDDSNPSRQRTGNQNLNRELENIFSLGFRTFNKKKRIYFFSRIAYSTIKDRIINVIQTDDETGFETRTYINNDDNYKVTFFTNVTKDFKTEHLLYSFRFAWHSLFGENTLFNNGTYKSQDVVLRPNIRSNFNFNDVFEIGQFYRLTYNKSEYDNESIRDQENTFHTFGLDFANVDKKRFNYSSEYSFIYRPDLVSGFDKFAHLWNVNLNYQVIPQKAKLKLTVYNLLNQDNTAKRFVNNSRITNREYQILKRFVMLSFTYKFIQ